MNPRTVALIVGMMAVTYIPRLLPGLWVGRYRLPPAFERWLQNIPYAALGALIFPGIVRGEPAWLGVLGGITAVLLSLWDAPLVAVMVVTIAVVFTASLWG